ncbi:transposase-like protein, partial [Colletotrichum incanum]
LYAFICMENFLPSLRRARTASTPRSINAQLLAASAASDASTLDLNTRDTFDSLPVAVWSGRRFVNAEAVSRKGARGRTSWIKAEGIFVFEILAHNTLGEAYWICRHCDESGMLKKLFVASATTGASTHLRLVHRITSSSEAESETPQDSEDSEPPSKRQRSCLVAIPKTKVSNIQELAIGYLVDASNPLTTFQNPYLQALLRQFDYDLFQQVNWSDKSQARELHQLYEAKRVIVKEEMRQALTKVHLSFDLWTSPNRLAIIAVFGHFINPAGNDSRYLLALRRQPGAHSGENIASTMCQVIRDWDLVDSVGAVVSDNASNNDTCLQNLYPQLSPSYTSEDAIHRRLRCYGHILNLVGRAFLHGVDREALEQESDALLDAGRLSDDLALWRARGPVGKLRNIIRYVRSSPQRSERFLAISNEADDTIDHEEAGGDTSHGFTLYQESSQELNLILSNDTRWNSTYLMLKRALLKRTQIDGFILNDKTLGNPSQRLPDDDTLTNEDWNILIELKDILEPLYQQTKRCEGWGRKGAHGRLWEVLSGMEYLLDRLEEWKKLFDLPTDEEIDLTASQLSQSQSNRSIRRLRTSQQASQSSQSSVRPPASITNIPTHARNDYLPAQRLAFLRQLHGGDFDSCGYLRLSITNAWQVLDRYYTKFAESPLYAASVILHPGLGLPWLEKRWNTLQSRTWILEAKEGLYEYWQRWYVNRTTPPPAATNAQGTFTSISTTPSVEDSGYTQWLNNRAHQVAANEASELDQYYRQTIAQPVDNPVRWWISHRKTFQLLVDLPSIYSLSLRWQQTVRGHLASPSLR